MKFRKIAAAVLAAAVLAATPATVALLSPLVVSASAEDTLTEGDYSYTVNEDGETVTIKKYNGTDAEVDIPGTLGGKMVTKIGGSAFYKCASLTNVTIPSSVTEIGGGGLAFAYCTSLTSVTIPNSVTEIGSQAFYNCTSLKSITIPDSVTVIWGNGDIFEFCTSLEEIIVGENNDNYSSSDGVLFNKYKTKLIYFPEGKGTTYTIPNSVIEIGRNAFQTGKTLTSVTIPDSVTTIGDYAFYRCTSLKSVTIPNSVVTIGESAFWQCTSLSCVTIPNSITTISPQTFMACESLTSVEIPNSVTVIDAMAFKECNSLTSVTIPDSVTTINDSTFRDCTSLEEITIGEDNENYSSVDGVLFNKDKSKLICYPAGKKGGYTIPDSVTEICSSAFHECTTVENVTIPDTVTKINGYTFVNCRALISVTIPSNVVAIGDYDFYGCNSLEKVFYSGTKEQWAAIIIGVKNECLTNAQIICTDGIINEREPDTSEPTSSDTSEPTSSDTSEPTSSDTSEPTSSETSEPTSSDTSEPTSSDTSEPTTSDTSEPTSSDTSEPTSSDTSEPTTSDTSEPTSSDISEPISSDPTSSDTSTPTSSDTSEAMSSDTSETEDLQPGDYFVDGDLEYTVLKDGTLEIRGFAGDETREIIIPETVRGKKVTSIGDAAFIDCTSLTSVTVPGSVTKIGGYAFSGCTSIETVNYGGRKSDWEAIDIDIENDALTNAEIKFAETTVEIVDEDTNVKAEISAEDKELDGAEFEADPADHPTLWDLIKKIIEKAVDTIESVTEEAQKSLEEAAEAVKNGKGFAYDMGFKKHGKEVKPDKSVTVSVPVPDKFKNDIDKLNVYHLTNRGAVYVPSWIKDGSIMFKTNSFSPYVITVDTLANAVVDDPANTESSNVSVPDTTTSVPSGTTSNDLNPSTGITMAIAPIAVVAVIAAVVSKKKK